MKDLLRFVLLTCVLVVHLAFGPNDAGAQSVVCRAPGGIYGFDEPAATAKIYVPASKTTSKLSELKAFLTTHDGCLYVHSNFVSEGYDVPTKIAIEKSISIYDICFNLAYTKKPPGFNVGTFINTVDKDMTFYVEEYLFHDAKFKSLGLHYATHVYVVTRDGSEVPIGANAVEQIAKIADPWEGLAKTKKYALGPNTPDGSIKLLSGAEAKMAALQAKLTATCLEHSLKEVVPLAEKGLWSAAADQARVRLKLLEHSSESRQVLAEFVSSKDYLAGLQHLEADPLSADLSPLLPQDLQAAAKGVRSIHILKADLKVNKKDGPTWSAVSVRKSIQQLVEATGDTRRGDQLLRGFVVKALLEGRPGEGLALLQTKDFGSAPEKSGPTYAALLRDLKVLALGEGQVHTGLGDAAIGNPRRGGATTRGPPEGLNLLIPQENLNDWRPRQGDTVADDLPPPEKVLEGLETATKKKFEEAVARERKVLAHEQKVILAKVYYYHPQFGPKKDDGKEDPEDEEAFLTEVERHLGGAPLTAEERTQVLAWRQQRHSLFAIVGMVQSSRQAK